MRSRMWILAFGAVAACSREPEGLEGTEVDDQLLISGRVCAEGDAAGAFPVRVLFAIDQSGDVQFTDPANLRIEALRQAIAPYLGTPDVEVGIFGFNTLIRDLIPAYTRDPAVIETALQALSSPDGISDFDSAFSYAFTSFANQAALIPEEQRAHARFAMVFVSDGTPSTMPPFNTRESILHAVDVLVGLRDLYGLGEVRVSTRRLARDDVPVNDPSAKPLMDAIAEHGGGTSRDLLGPDAFESFDTIGVDLPRRYGIVGLLANNVTGRESEWLSGRKDSDRDGVIDGDEVLPGGEPYVYDVHVDGACADFQISNITLLATAGDGRNRIVVDASMGPVDEPDAAPRFKTACVEQRFVPPQQRTPPSSEAVLRDAAFVPLAELDLDRDCGFNAPGAILAP